VLDTRPLQSPLVAAVAEAAEREDDQHDDQDPGPDGHSLPPFSLGLADRSPNGDRLHQAGSRGARPPTRGRSGRSHLRRGRTRRPSSRSCYRTGGAGKGERRGVREGARHAPPSSFPPREKGEPGRHQTLATRARSDCSRADTPNAVQEKTRARPGSGSVGRALLDGLWECAVPHAATCPQSGVHPPSSLTGESSSM
jgi:hypothetical protein